jgi:hypothetical protein
MTILPRIAPPIAFWNAAINTIKRKRRRAEGGGVRDNREIDKVADEPLRAVTGKN